MIFHIINFPNNRHNIFIIRQNSRFRMSRFIKLHNSFRKLYKNIWRRAMYPEFRWLILQTRNIWLINIVIFSINNSVATVRFELVSRISSSPDSVLRLRHLPMITSQFFIWRQVSAPHPYHTSIPFIRDFRIQRTCHKATSSSNLQSASFFSAWFSEKNTSHFIPISKSKTVFLSPKDR